MGTEEAKDLQLVVLTEARLAEIERELAELDRLARELRGPAGDRSLRGVG